MLVSIALSTTDRCWSRTTKICGIKLDVTKQHCLHWKWLSCRPRTREWNCCVSLHFLDSIWIVLKTTFEIYATAREDLGPGAQCAPVGHLMRSNKTSHVVQGFPEWWLALKRIYYHIDNVTIFETLWNFWWRCVSFCEKLRFTKKASQRCVKLPEGSLKYLKLTERYTKLPTSKRVAILSGLSKVSETYWKILKRFHELIALIRTYVLRDSYCFRAAAEEFLSHDLPLHGLINNAGVYPGSREETKQGFEMTFGVNHLGCVPCFGLICKAPTNQVGT